VPLRPEGVPGLSDSTQRGSVPFSIFGDGWVFLAAAELQNIYLLKEWQGQGIGTHLLGIVAHRLAADGSRSMCVGYDSNSPYKRFYFKYGAIETAPASPCRRVRYPPIH